MIPFLLLDPHTPRSLRYGLEAVKGYLERIGGGAETTTAVRFIGRLHAELCYRDEPAGATTTADAGFLDRVVDTMVLTHDAVAAQYFAT